MIEMGEKVYCDGGMSPEIAFTKYYSHRVKKVYAGWNVSIKMVYDDIVAHSLLNVVKTIKMVESEGCQKTVLHSPGFLSVPYLNELCNFVYLPSQFLVGFNNISDLRSMLLNLKIKGIKAYAVAGYDGCVPECLVAWIKFIEMPPCYREVIDYLKSEKVILAGVFDKEGKTLGENVIFQYGPCAEKIEEGDIYFLHIHTCYGGEISKDWEIFKRLCPDFEPESILATVKCGYVGDWESAFDFMTKEYFPCYAGSVHFLFAGDTKPLYDLSFVLSEFFMKINRIPVKGLVLNPYIMNSPTYETNYGYIAYCHWAGSDNLEKELFGKYREGMEIWFNDQNSQKKGVREEIEKRKIKLTYIDNSSPLCEELTNWILGHKPRSYSQKDFVSAFQLQRLCRGVAVHFD